MSTASAWCPRASARSPAPATRCSSRRTRALAPASPTPSTSASARRSSRARTRSGSASEMIVKVKEPIAPEYERMQHGQIIYTYFHLAGVDPELTKVLVKKKVAAVAYETMQLDDGASRCSSPMSEVAGKMAIQVGATLPGEGARRQGHPAGRRARRAPRPRRHHRRRRGRAVRREGRGGHGRRGHHPRRQPRAPHLPG